MFIYTQHKDAFKIFLDHATTAMTSEVDMSGCKVP